MLLLYKCSPITVVSGPEIMDKFVGSSEMKLREIFDNPPDIYEAFQTQDDGDAIAKAVSRNVCSFSIVCFLVTHS